MNVCYTALFSNYEELKEPRIITPGWQYVCFTDQPIESKVWEIRRVELHDTPQRMARYYKIMEWVDWERSFWVDASFIIDVDLSAWWNKYFAKGLSAPYHPLRQDWLEECMDCIISGRGDRVQVDTQMNEYKVLELPRQNGLITSGLLMRENTPEIIELCEQWWAELVPRSVRDQIAFCRVSLNKDHLVNMYRFDYRMGREFIYHHHFNRR